jgi:hypothetical protein
MRDNNNNKKSTQKSVGWSTMTTAIDDVTVEVEPEQQQQQETTIETTIETTTTTTTDDDWTFRCVCGTNDDDGRTQIECGQCRVWQHAICYGWQSAREVPDDFLCDQCLPRTVACLCDRSVADSRIVQCHDCDRWQHMRCVGLDRGSRRPRVPKTYLCGPCSRQRLDTRASHPATAARRRRVVSPFAAILDPRLRGELEADLAVLRSDAALPTAAIVVPPTAAAAAAAELDVNDWLARLTPLHRVLLEKYYIRLTRTFDDASSLTDEQRALLLRAVLVLMQCSGEMLGAVFRRIGAELRLHGERRAPDAMEQRRAAARDVVLNKSWREMSTNEHSAVSDGHLQTAAAMSADIPVTVAPKSVLQPLRYDIEALPMVTLGPTRGQIGYRVVLLDHAVAGQFICECVGRVAPLRRLVDPPPPPFAGKRKRVDAVVESALQPSAIVDSDAGRAGADAQLTSTMSGDGPLFAAAPPILLPDTPRTLVLSSRMVALDARDCGAPVTRYVRRSCAPNAVAVPLQPSVSVMRVSSSSDLGADEQATAVAAPPDARLRIGLFAKQDLAAGTEVTIEFDSPWPGLPYTPILRRCAGESVEGDATSAHSGCTLAALEHASDAVPQVDALLDRVADQLRSFDLTSSAEAMSHDPSADDVDAGDGETGGGGGGDGGGGGGGGFGGADEHATMRKEVTDLLVTTLNPITTPIGRLSREERKMQQIMKRFAKMEGKGDPDPVVPVVAVAAAAGSPVKKPRTVRTGGRGRPRNVVSPTKATPPPSSDGSELRKPGRGRPRGSTLANKAAAAAAQAAAVDERLKRAKFTSDDDIKNDAVRELLGDDDSDEESIDNDGDHQGDADSDGHQSDEDVKQATTAATIVEDEPDFASPLSMKKAWIKKAASSNTTTATTTTTTTSTTATTPSSSTTVEQKSAPSEPISMKRKLLESYRANAADEPTQPSRPRLSRPEMVEMLFALIRQQ